MIERTALGRIHFVSSEITVTLIRIGGTDGFSSNCVRKSLQYSRSTSYCGPRLSSAYLSLETDTRVPLNAKP